MKKAGRKRSESFPEKWERPRCSFNSFERLYAGSTYALIAWPYSFDGHPEHPQLAIGEVFMLGAVFGPAFVKLGLPIHSACYWRSSYRTVSLVIERFSFRPLRNAPRWFPC